MERGGGCWNDSYSEKWGGGARTTLMKRGDFYIPRGPGDCISINGGGGGGRGKLILGSS